jgi:type IV secretory pathway TraG/TraD family ATPase VirD4
MSFEQRLQQWDAQYGLPRRADEPYLPAYHAFLRCVQDATQMLFLLLAGLLATLCLYRAARYFEVGFYAWLVYLALMLVAMLVAAGEAAQQLLPYYQFNQLLTYGTARWATPLYLQGAGLAQANGETLAAGALPLGKLPRPLRSPCHFVLPPDLALGSLVFFGPPRSGKSVLLMSYLRSLAVSGWSVVVLDPKGELYEYCAPYFRQLYRLDFAHPECSDRWNFLPRCRGDKEFAHTMASIMLGLDGKQYAGTDPFWQESELALLTALLLYLPTIIEQPTPALVHEFIALRSFVELCDELGECPDHDIQVQWGTFTKAPEQTRGSVFTGLAAKINPFTIDAARAVSAPLTPAERERGARDIDFADLREPGTGLFLVIPEGAASRYKVPLATFLGQAVEHLREGAVTDETTPVMFVVDEAAHVPLANLKEIPGVGRGRKFSVMLFYQNLSQGYDLYGEHGFHAILGSINTKTFLPGCDLVTARYASEMVGQTTVWGRAFDDAAGTQYDKTRTTEAARPLMDPAEIRQLPVHQQAVTIIETMPPVKWTYPPPAKSGPRALPRRYGLPQVVSLRHAPRLVLPPTSVASMEVPAEARLVTNEPEATPLMAVATAPQPVAEVARRALNERVVREQTEAALDDLFGFADEARLPALSA